MVKSVFMPPLTEMAVPGFIVNWMVEVNVLRFTRVMLSDKRVE